MEARQRCFCIRPIFNLTFTLFSKCVFDPCSPCKPLHASGVLINAAPWQSQKNLRWKYFHFCTTALYQNLYLISPLHCYCSGIIVEAQIPERKARSDAFVSVNLRAMSTCPSGASRQPLMSTNGYTITPYHGRSGVSNHNGVECMDTILPRWIMVAWGKRDVVGHHQTIKI